MEKIGQERCTGNKNKEEIKMRKYHSILIPVLIISIAISFSVDVRAQAPTPDNPLTLDVGHILAPDSFQNQALLVFKELVEERTEGAVKINVFPAEQLGHAPDMVENVSIGAQAMMLGSQTWWEVYSDRIGVATVPFMFEDREHFNRWTEKVFIPEILSEVIERGNQRFINLDYLWHRGPFRVIVSTKPIFTPEDLENITMRLWPARMIQESWAGYNISIEVIDFAEVYLALQYGMIEAVTSPFDLVWPQRFTEVAKYVTALQQYPQLELITINNDIWERLSPEQQSIMVECVNKAGEWYNEQTYGRFEDLKDLMISEHDAVYIEVNREPFVEIMHNQIIPDLVAEGLLMAEWIEAIEDLR